MKFDHMTSRISVLMMVAATQFSPAAAGQLSPDAGWYHQSASLQPASHKTEVYAKDMIVSTKSLRTLGEIERLEENWNGYGAQPISKRAIELARLIVQDTFHQPRIIPTGRRSVQLEYESKDKTYLELEIFDDKVKFLIVPMRDYSEAIEGTLPVESAFYIPQMIDDLYASEGEGTWTTKNDFIVA